MPRDGIDKSMASAENIYASTELSIKLQLLMVRAQKETMKYNKIAQDASLVLDMESLSQGERNSMEAFGWGATELAARCESLSQFAEHMYTELDNEDKTVASCMSDLWMLMKKNNAVVDCEHKAIVDICEPLMSNVVDWKDPLCTTSIDKLHSVCEAIHVRCREPRAIELLRDYAFSRFHSFHPSPMFDQGSQETHSSPVSSGAINKRGSTEEGPVDDLIQSVLREAKNAEQEKKKWAALRDNYEFSVSKNAAARAKDALGDSSNSSSALLEQLRILSIFRAERILFYACKGLSEKYDALNFRAKKAENLALYADLSGDLLLKIYEVIEEKNALDDCPYRPETSRFIKTNKGVYELDRDLLFSAIGKDDTTLRSIKNACDDERRKAGVSPQLSQSNAAEAHMPLFISIPPQLSQSNAAEAHMPLFISIPPQIHFS